MTRHQLRMLMLFIAGGLLVGARHVAGGTSELLELLSQLTIGALLFWEVLRGY